MGNKEKRIVEIIFIFANIFILILNGFLLKYDFIIFELFLPILLIQILLSLFLIGMYILHKNLKKLANDLNFHFTTRFLEQPRMEGTYKNNWWQIHFTSRDYSKYWGLPRTYLKLQFKEDKTFNEKILKGYVNCEKDHCNIINIQHIKRPFKNYLLMRLDWYVIDKKRIQKAMNLLLKIAKESNLKKK